MSALINCKNQIIFVLHSLRLTISIVLNTFHVMLYSVLEERKGSNGNSSHGCSQNSPSFCAERLFMVKECLDWSSPKSVFHLSFGRNIFLQESLCSHTQPYHLLLGGAVYLDSPSWRRMGCRREIVRSPSVGPFKIWLAVVLGSLLELTLLVQEGLIRGSWEVPSDLNHSVTLWKAQVSRQFTISACGSVVTDRLLKGVYNKTKVCP